MSVDTKARAYQCNPSFSASSSPDNRSPFSREALSLARNVSSRSNPRSGSPINSRKRSSTNPCTSCLNSSGLNDEKSMWGENTESGVEMQSVLALAGGRGLFQLLNESAQAHLLGLCNDQELDANALRPAPANRGILYL